uniref:RNA helicase n=1 Tax=Lutzomyia longipalpis TaxID=7200 RepID=A0A1B0CPV5_LUTLO
MFRIITRNAFIMYNNSFSRNIASKPVILANLSSRLSTLHTDFIEDNMAPHQRSDRGSFRDRRSDGGDRRGRGGGGGGDNRRDRDGHVSKPAGKFTMSASMRAPNWDMSSLRPFKRDFYEPHPMTIKRSQTEVERYREEHQITVVGQAHNPIQSFGEVRFPDYVMNGIRRQGYESPTPIQAQGWPIALSGSNMQINQHNKPGKVIIFVETKRKVEHITRALRYYGLNVFCIHGDKSQNERDYVLREFRKGDCPILVATDVAARGLDVEGINFVINFDYPQNSEDYIHRIGRTGRSQSTGTSFALFTKQNCKQAKDLIAVLQEANQEVNPKLMEMARMGGGGNDGRRWGRSAGGGGARRGGMGGYGGANNGYGAAGRRNDAGQRFGGGAPRQNGMSNGNSGGGGAYGGRTHTRFN